MAPRNEAEVRLEAAMANCCERWSEFEQLLGEEGVNTVMWKAFVLKMEGLRVGIDEDFALAEAKRIESGVVATQTEKTKIEYRLRLAAAQRALYESKFHEMSLSVPGFYAASRNAHDLIYRMVFVFQVGDRRDHLSNAIAGSTALGVLRAFVNEYLDKGR